MEKNIVYLLIVALSSSAVYCQSPGKINAQEDIKIYLCHTWQFTYKGNVDSSIKQVFPAEIPTTGFVKFNANGTWLLYKDTDTTKGNWILNEKTLDLTLKSYKQNQTVKILKLTSDELVLENKVNDKLAKTYLKKAK